jgi:hypothetical protein
MLVFGLSPAQLMQQHNKEVKELALANGPTVTHDTFMLPTNVRNIRVQCKAFGFVRNKQHEGIACFAIMRASTIHIPYTNVLI